MKKTQALATPSLSGSAPGSSSRSLNHTILLSRVLQCQLLAFIIGRGSLEQVFTAVTPLNYA